MKTIYSTLCALVLTGSLSAGDIWISPQGNDRNNGTQVAPKATLTSAVRQAREWRRLQSDECKGGITIHLMNGEYALYEPLFLRPEDSGTNESPTIIRAQEAGKVTLSGGTRITNWRRGKGGVWIAPLPRFNGCILNFRQLWTNGAKAIRARDVVNFEQMHRILHIDTDNEIVWVPAASVKKILGASAPEMVLHQMWCVANLRIKSIDVQGDSAAIRFHQPESRIQFEHPWPRPMVTTDGHNSAFYLTNARELLDTPGEWYHDEQTIYYLPRPGEDMTTTNVVAPAIETLVQVQGTLDNPVKHLAFEGICFSHTTWMRPSQKGHVPLQAGMYLTDGYAIDPKMIRNYDNHLLDNQGWLGRPAAAVQVQAAQSIDFLNCSFEQLGSTGLDYVMGVGGGTVKGSVFRDVAGNGLLVGSFSPPAHETHIPYDPTDRRELCTHQTISNNRFTDVANEDWGCLAICAGYVSDITIEHNDISEVSYSGISLGWGWTQTVNCMKNNRVHANHIHHYGKHTYDVAGIYTLGAQPKSSITHNAVHSIYTPSYVHDPNHWFYLYTDEGSSFITVKDNWTQGEKFLQNANGPGNVWQNNGPTVSDFFKNHAGLEPHYKYLLNK